MEEIREVNVTLYIYVSDHYAHLIQYDLRECLINFLMERTHFAIIPQSTYYPYFTEEWVKHDAGGCNLIIQLPLYIYKTHLVQQITGWCFPIAQYFCRTRIIAKQLRTMLRIHVTQRIQQYDPTRHNIRLLHVSVLTV